MELSCKWESGPRHCKVYFTRMSGKKKLYEILLTCQNWRNTFYSWIRQSERFPILTHE